MISTFFDFLFCPQHGIMGNPGIAACVMALPLVLRNGWIKLKNWHARKAAAKGR